MRAIYPGQGTPKPLPPSCNAERKQSNVEITEVSSFLGKGRIFPEGGFPQISRRQCRRVAQVRCLGRVIVFGGRTYLRTGGSVSCSDCVTYQPPLAEAEEALPAVLTSIPAVSVVVLGDYVRVTSGKRELQFLESLRMRGTCPFHAMGVVNRSDSLDAYDRT